MTNFEQFVEDNEVYFVCPCGNKHGVVESFETKSERAVLVRAYWYDENGVFFEPKFVAEGKPTEIVAGSEWRIGAITVKKCSPVTEASIIVTIDAWRTIKTITPSASRDKCQDYVLDSYQDSFLREADLYL